MLPARNDVFNEPENENRSMKKKRLDSDRQVSAKKKCQADGDLRDLSNNGVPSERRNYETSSQHYAGYSVSVGDW